MWTSYGVPRPRNTQEESMGDSRTGAKGKELFLETGKVQGSGDHPPNHAPRTFVSDFFFGTLREV